MRPKRVHDMELDEVWTRRMTAFLIINIALLVLGLISLVVNP
jgi:uncharacterized membrane protein YiaA